MAVDKVFSAHYLFLHFDCVAERFLAHAHAATSVIVNIIETQRHRCHFIWLLNGLCSDDQLSPVSVALVAQIVCEHLSRRSHNFAEWCDNLSNLIVVASAIPINHHKPHCLFLFKEVRHRDGCHKVWIELVFNLLCHSNLNPLSVTLLENQALGIWLAKGVQVFKFAAWDK